MKLRILDQTLRFRLTMTDANQLMNGQSVRSEVRFPENHRFGYTLSPEDLLSARFENENITVCLPKEQCRNLGDRDSLEFLLRTEDGGDLKIIVEKDFTCQKPRKGLDDVDTFPNQAAGTC